MSLSARDKFEIQEVITRLYQALDAHDAERYALQGERILIFQQLKNMLKIIQLLIFINNK
jgi:hypothetical protein